MPQTYDGADMQLWIGVVGASPDFRALGGEEQCRIEITRDWVAQATVNQTGWANTLPTTGTAQLRLEAEGRTAHGVAEERLHAAAISGAALPVQLRVRGSVCLQSDCVVAQCHWNAHTDDVARYRVVLLSHGVVIYTAPSN